MTSRITIVQRNNDDEEQLLGFRLMQHTELPNPVTPPPWVMVPSVFKNLYAPSWPSENKDRNSILHFFGCNHLTFLLLAPARILYRIYRHTYFKAYQCNASRLFFSQINLRQSNFQHQFPHGRTSTVASTHLPISINKHQELPFPWKLTGF